MQNSLFDEQIVEVTGSSNTSYILKNHDMFYDIGFRVMKNQKSGSIMECHQLKYNGKYKFVFFTDEYTRLSDLISSVEPDRIMVIISNLIRSIEDVQSNGFLNVACIDNRLDHIFVDNRTFAVRLIYLPINIPMNGMKKAEFESDVRAQLIKLIQNLPNAGTGKLIELENVLMDRNIMSLAGVAKELHVSPVGQQILNTVPVSAQRKKVQEEPVQSKPVKAQSASLENQYILISQAGKENITVTKSQFLIGKSADKVDGVISGNSAVSRVHCEIIVNDLGGITIMDKGSANGTFVNGSRIATEQQTALRINDRIKIANEEYVLVRR